MERSAVSLSLNERLANNATYVQKPPTLETRAGAFLWIGGNQSPLGWYMNIHGDGFTQ